jgi:DNA polymerase
MFLDFETYYDDEYSLRRMTTREYIMDPRFRAHALAVAEGSAEPFVLVGTDAVRDWVLSQDWGKLHVVAHNAAFDVGILCWRFGVTPKLISCTAQMARAAVVHAGAGKADLGTLSKWFGLPDKDTEALVDMAGVDLDMADRTSPEVDRFIKYSLQDVGSCREIYRRLRPLLSKEMMLLIDRVTRMYHCSDMVLDPTVLDEAEAEELAARVQAMAACGVHDEADLRSRERFAALLRSLGVEPPVRISPATGEHTYDFSRKSVEFMALTNHEDERVRTLVEARLLAASSVERTRVAKFKALAAIPGAGLHAPLLVSGAHTHRFSGADGINLQNLPRDGKLRKAIRVPEGRCMVVVDASQIEARIVAWLAGCDKLTEAFAQKRDVYSEFASLVFGYEVKKSTHPRERRIGKEGILSLGYGAGAKTVWSRLAVQGVDVEFDLVEHMVRLYRSDYREIPALWRSLEDNALRALMGGGPWSWGPVRFDEGHWQVVLPDGSTPWPAVHYPQLHKTWDGETGRWVYVYFAARKGIWKNLYGGALTENVVQHLAWTVIAHAMLRLTLGKPERKLLLQVHDELVLSVPEGLGEETLHEAIEVLSQVPAWAAAYPEVSSVPLPLAAEGAVTTVYGEAK